MLARCSRSPLQRARHPADAARVPLQQYRRRKDAGRRRNAARALAAPPPERWDLCEQAPLHTLYSLLYKTAFPDTVPHLLPPFTHTCRKVVGQAGEQWAALACRLASRLGRGKGAGCLCVWCWGMEVGYTVVNLICRCDPDTHDGARTQVYLEMHDFKHVFSFPMHATVAACMYSPGPCRCMHAYMQTPAHVWPCCCMHARMHLAHAHPHRCKHTRPLPKDAVRIASMLRVGQSP
eukprot:351123-Chlamydomonas_euryale.AAC.2